MKPALTFQVVSVDGGPNVYYAGDTGYCPVFPEIGEMGPFNLSLIPIVPEEPRQSMKAQHIGHEEAIKVHQEVGSKLSIGVHWGLHFSSSAFKNFRLFHYGQRFYYRNTGKTSS